MSESTSPELAKVLDLLAAHFRGEPARQRALQRLAESSADLASDARVDLAAAVAEIASALDRVATIEENTRTKAGFSDVSSEFEFRLDRARMHVDNIARLLQEHEAGAESRPASSDDDWLVVDLADDQRTSLVRELRNYSRYRGDVGDIFGDIDYSEFETVEKQDAAYRHASRVENDAAEAAQPFDELAEQIDRDAVVAMTPGTVYLLFEVFGNASWEPGSDETPEHLQALVDQTDRHWSQLTGQWLAARADGLTVDGHMTLVAAHTNAETAMQRARGALDRLADDAGYRPEDHPTVWRDLDDSLDRAGTNLRVNAAGLNRPDFRELTLGDWQDQADAIDERAAMEAGEPAEHRTEIDAAADRSEHDAEAIELDENPMRDNPVERVAAVDDQDRQEVAPAADPIVAGTSLTDESSREHVESGSDREVTMPDFHQRSPTDTATTEKAALTERANDEVTDAELMAGIEEAIDAGEMSIYDPATAHTFVAEDGDASEALSAEPAEQVPEHEEAGSRETAIQRARRALDEVQHQQYQTQAQLAIEDDDLARWHADDIRQQQDIQVDDQSAYGPALGR